MTNALSLVAEEQVRFHTESIVTLRALVEKGEGELAKPLLAKIKKQKDRMEEDARKRTLEPEYEKQGKEGWMTDYDAAKAKAKREWKFLFIHFMNPSRTAPKVMLNNVYYQPERARRLSMGGFTFLITRKASLASCFLYLSNSSLSISGTGIEGRLFPKITLP